MRLLLLIIIIFFQLSYSSSAISKEFIGFTPEQFKAHYRSQIESKWCWAATAEMIFSSQGVEYGQARIVRDIKGETLDSTASIIEMFNTTNGIIKDRNGNKFVVSGQLLKGLPAPTVLYNYIKQKKPVIIIYGHPYANRHSVVLTGMEIEFSIKIEKEELKVQSLHIYDPYIERKAKIYSPPLNYASRLQSDFEIFPGKVISTILVDITAKNS